MSIVCAPNRPGVYQYHMHYKSRVASSDSTAASTTGCLAIDATPASTTACWAWHGMMTITRAMQWQNRWSAEQTALWKNKSMQWMQVLQLLTNEMHALPISKFLNTWDSHAKDRYANTMHCIETTGGGLRPEATALCSVHCLETCGHGLCNTGK